MDFFVDFVDDFGVVVVGELCCVGGVVVLCVGVVSLDY